MSTATGLSVDFGRLRSRLDELAQIGPIDGGGSCRLALTDEDKAGRDLVVAWMRDLGTRVEIDGIGNVVATWPADDHRPAVMTGSHIDTVRTGGRYDGNYGVIGGLEVIETIIESGIRLERPVAVAFFTGEEGARYAPDMLGSLVYAGGLGLEPALAIVGTDGSVLGDELVRIGYQGGLPTPGPVPYAFVELHIEQGPVLEAEGDVIGAVTSVQGISWTEMTITGQSNHAGTTPMALRHDAGYAAAELAVAVRRIAQELDGNQVATVGRLSLHPDLVNVVASKAVLTADLRNTDERSLEEAERRLGQACRQVEVAEGVTVTTRSLARFEPVEFDERIIALVEATASHHGRAVRRMPSGAGHDAQMLARVCPAGMVFVPSRGGLSHNPAEHTDDEHLCAGADVLLDVVLHLAIHGVGVS